MPTHYETLHAGTIVDYYSTAPNGNVWFIHNSLRGKIVSDSLNNLLKKGILEEI
jgi:hypothetical protein